MSKYRLILLATTTAATLACGSSPTAPTPIAVTPNVAGSFGGAYRTTNCTEIGAAQGSGFCASVSNGGGMTLIAQQAGSTLTGTLTIGGFPTPISGTVDTSGVVTLTGQGPIQLGAVLTLTAFRATLSGSQLVGTGTHTISTTQPVGAATIQTSFTLVR